MAFQLYVVQENLGLFQADAESLTWQSYVDYIDDYIVDGLFNTILCSLTYFLENTDVEMNPSPLFKTKMELQVWVLHFHT